MSRKRRLAAAIVTALVTAIAVARVFSVDLFPVMTADSGHYVGEAVSGKYTDAPLAILTPRHFKTAGYPLLLSATRALATALDADFLTLVVIIQRALLALACLWIAWELRLAAIPLLLLLSSNAFVTQSNFVLTEGATIPVAALFALSLLGAHRLRHAEPGRGRALRWLALAVLAASLAFLVLTKIVFASFALLTIPLALDVRRGPLGRLVLATRAAPVAAAILGLTVGYVAAVSLDNYAAFGRLTPSIGTERIFYWGLWEEAFEARPQNRAKPDLRPFYDRGSPYRFLHRVERECGGLGNFECTRPLQLARAEELAEASNISLPRARAAAFFRGLVGGGKVELDGLREQVLAASGDPAAIESWQRRQIRRFGELYNGGVPARVVTGIAGEREPEESPRTAQLLITLGLLGGLVFFALRGRVPIHSLHALSLVSYALVIGAFAFVLVDLWRYIAPVWVAFAVLQTAGVADATRALWREGEATE